MQPSLRTTALIRDCQPWLLSPYSGAWGPCPLKFQWPAVWPGHWYITQAPRGFLGAAKVVISWAVLSGTGNTLPFWFVIDVIIFWWIYKSQCSGHCREDANAIDTVSVLWMFIRWQTIIFCIVCCLMKQTEQYLKYRCGRAFHTLPNWKLTETWWEQIRKCEHTEVRECVQMYMAKRAGNQIFQCPLALPFFSLSSGITVKISKERWGVGEAESQKLRWRNYSQIVCEGMRVCV